MLMFLQVLVWPPHRRHLRVLRILRPAQTRQDRVSSAADAQLSGGRSAESRGRAREAGVNEVSKQERNYVTAKYLHVPQISMGSNLGHWFR